MVHIDITDKSIDYHALIKQDKINQWDYENSQIEHEHKLMRQAQLLQERIKQETLYKQKQRKLQRLREREHLLQQNRKQSVTKPTLKATTHKHIEDDGPEL